MKMASSNIENVLQRINSKFISLNNDEVRENNKLLKNTLEKMIEIMKDLDSVFKLLFNKVFYGGSYYDDLKVGHADEFDLDLLLTIPKLCQKTGLRTCNCVQLSLSNKPGYFWLKIDKDHHQDLIRFLEDGYVQTNLILQWMKRLVTKALNKLSAYEQVDFCFTTPKWLSESGPALTLQLDGPFGHFDIDLVPAFQFGLSDWPTNYTNNSGKDDFFIVPKKAKIDYGERFWRASFQEQERALICGKQRLKPALRLLKKMRNSLEHVSISSYALKTIVLWDLETFNWESSLQDTFLRLLKNYDDHLRQGKIPYYWQKKANLLEYIKPETLRNHGNEISKKLATLERTKDPLVVADIILKKGSREFNEYEKDYNSSLIQWPNITVNDDHESSNDDQLQTTNISEWGTAALIVGGVAALGVGIWRVLSGNNRNQNN